jgi:hypothetical protein
MVYQLITELRQRAAVPALRPIRHRFAAVAQRLLAYQANREVARLPVDAGSPLLLFSSNATRSYDHLYALASYLLARHQRIPSAHLSNPLIGSNFRVAGEPLAGILSRPLPVAEAVTPAWSSDFGGAFVGADNFNVFDYVVNRVQTRLKRYQLDFNDPETSRYLRETAQQARAVYALYLMLCSAPEHRHRPIIFVGREPEYCPDGVLRYTAEFDPSGRFFYADFGFGYYHYFGGQPNQPMFLSVNATAERKPSRMVLSRHDLVPTLPVDGDNVLKRVRARQTDAAADRGTLSTLRRLKQEGHRIFVLFAHLFYDKPAADRAEAFSSMLDWIDATINLFRDPARRSDVLVLKPHIVEQWYGQEHRNPNQTLAQYVGRRAADEPNIYLLEPRELTVENLLPAAMDVGLIWRSSVGLELIQAQQRVIVAGRAPYCEAVGIEPPSSLAEYAALIDEGGIQYDAEAALKYIVSLRDAHVNIKTDALTLFTHTTLGNPALAQWLTRLLPESAGRSAVLDAQELMAHGSSLRDPDPQPN